jgi:hypothetical protein
MKYKFLFTIIILSLFGNLSAQAGSDGKWILDRSLTQKHKDFPNLGEQSLFFLNAMEHFYGELTINNNSFTKKLEMMNESITIKCDIGQLNLQHNTKCINSENGNLWNPLSIYLEDDLLIWKFDKVGDDDNRISTMVFRRQ